MIKNETNNLKQVLKNLDRKNKLIINTKTGSNYHGCILKNVEDDYIEFIRTNNNVVYLKYEDLSSFEIDLNRK